MARTDHGLPGIYNATPIVVPSGSGSALAVNGSGQLITTIYGANVSPDGALNTTTTQPIILDMVDGTTLNSDIWSTSTSGMTITQTQGVINLNAGAATTANAYAILQSIKNVEIIAGTTAVIGFGISMTVAPEANATIEFGFGTVSTNTAPTDGIFFRLTSTGFFAVTNFGGVETTSPLTAPTVGTTHIYAILASQLSSIFFDNTTGFAGAPIAYLPTPPNQASSTVNSKQLAFCRVYNGVGTPATAPQVSISTFGYDRIDNNNNKKWSDTQVGMGKGSYQGATTYTQSANHTNSTDPVSATLANTTAGYTTLGGRYQFAAPATATTDFALFAYQVPVGFQLYVTEISISAINLGAAVATTATVLDWSIGINSSAVSLATTDTSTTWAPRRIPLGMQSFAVSAAIGATANDIRRSFTSSLVVDSGRYLHIIIEVPVGTATASQIVRGDVTINGYFE